MICASPPWPPARKNCGPARPAKQSTTQCAASSRKQAWPTPSPTMPVVPTTVVASATPVIHALDSSWWNPYYNVYQNANCVWYNFFHWNWGPQCHAQTWQQVVAPAPSNCIYSNPDNSAYNGYYD